MSALTFIQVENHWVNIDAIDYVDFLNSGRAIVFIPGLRQEKQNISLITRRLI